MTNALPTPELPPLLTPAQVGKACDVSRRSAKHMPRAAGVLEQHGNGRSYVERTRLRERLPDVFARAARS